MKRWGGFSGGMTETQWLYDLIAALDRIADEAQAVDEVPNVKEWVEAIRAEERERCVAECDNLAEQFATDKQPHLGNRSSVARKCADAIYKLGGE